MTADIVKLLAPSRKDESAKKSKPKPLNALQVKRHKEGTLSDAHPHRGLRLRANKNGTKTWLYRYRVGKKLREIKLGTHPGVDLAEARRLYNEQKILREQNKDPRREAEKRRREMEKQEFTFAVMVEQYLTERVQKDRKPKGAQETRRMLENDLGKLANRLVDQVSPTDIHDHILIIAGRAPNIALNFRAELARSWRYAVNIGTTERPCPINSDMGGQLRQGKRERNLSAIELKQFLPWIHNYSETVRDVLTLTLYLGLRSGEVCKLRNDWLIKEKDGWWITIPAHEMKKDHSDHRVPLSGTALEIALRRSEDNKKKGYWFPSRVHHHIQQKVLGVEVYSHSGRSKAKAYKNKATCPVSDWAPNDLRKTARTHLAALGCPFEVAETLLHHRLPSVGGLYNQYHYDTEKREWLTQLGECFDLLAT